MEIQDSTDWLLIALSVLGLGCVIAAALAVAAAALRARGEGPSWTDALRSALNVLRHIEESGWKPDIVIGIGRSGGIWGGWLAGNLGSLPFSVIDKKYIVRSGIRYVEFRAAESVLEGVRDLAKGKKLRVLLVEGATSTGHTFRSFRTDYSEWLSDWDIKSAVLYQSPISATPVDFVGARLDPWPPKFPWHVRDSYKSFLTLLTRVILPGKSGEVG